MRYIEVVDVHTGETHCVGIDVSVDYVLDFSVEPPETAETSAPTSEMKP